jgi:hypothetical protein
MLLMGLNQQPDLPTWFIQVLRDLSRQQGWYEARRAHQFAFVIALIVVGSLSFLLAAVILRRILVRVRLALLGLGVITIFAVTRVALLEHVRALAILGSPPLNCILELGGIGLFGISAWATGNSSRGAAEGRERGPQEKARRATTSFLRSRQGFLTEY